MVWLMLCNHAKCSRLHPETPMDEVVSKYNFCSNRRKNNELQTTRLGGLMEFDPVCVPCVLFRVFMLRVRVSVQVHEGIQAKHLSLTTRSVSATT